jgi:hypothetical protein
MIKALGHERATLVVHDWGGIVGCAGGRSDGLTDGYTDWGPREVQQDLGGIGGCSARQMNCWMAEGSGTISLWRRGLRGM